jgi:hypothetical protein
MPELQRPLLAHLQREAKNARERDGASIDENEKQIAASCQPLDEGRTLLRCLRELDYEM